VVYTECFMASRPLGLRSNRVESSADADRPPFAVLTSPISNNVGQVKHYERTPPQAPLEGRHFALVDGLRFLTLGPLLIVWGQELSPTQPSLRSPTAIMIACSNSPCQNHIAFVVNWCKIPMVLTTRENGLPQGGGQPA
jgi:hypothetical protein